MTLDDEDVAQFDVEKVELFSLREQRVDRARKKMADLALPRFEFDFRFLFTFSARVTTRDSVSGVKKTVKERSPCYKVCFPFHL